MIQRDRCTPSAHTCTGTILASASADGYVVFHDFASRTCLQRLSVSTSPCLHVAMHPTYCYAAVCDWHGRVDLWR